MAAERSGVRATLNYLSDGSDINRRFVAPGAEINTGTYLPHEVEIRNARALPAPPTLDDFGFTLSVRPSAVGDFHDSGQVERLYPGEVVGIVRELTGADIVIPLGWVLRTSGDTKDGKVQPPAADVHVDMLPDRAEKLAAALAERPEMAGRPYRRFIASSLWRAFSPPPQDYPLALCDARTVTLAEGVPNSLIYVDALPEGEARFDPIPDEDSKPAAAVFRFNPAHRFYFFPDMVRDEIVMFKFYDSDPSRARRVPHTAFQDRSIVGAPPRESIELRTIAYFL